MNSMSCPIATKKIFKKPLNKIKPIHSVEFYNRVIHMECLDPNGGISFNLKSLKISVIAARNSKIIALFLGA